MARHLAIDKEKTLSPNKLTKGNMHKYLERRRAKRIKKWEAEFDKAFIKFLKEEKLYGRHV